MPIVTKITLNRYGPEPVLEPRLKSGHVYIMLVADLKIKVLLHGMNYNEEVFDGEIHDRQECRRCCFPIP
ncbi:hypothetical protein HMSSN139_62620 [Paenibacillus sp. HMSSN-139]|nr:hypothetical protein HMSSN139_62620 [Paenibacillus sp. HMSSN-139]